MEHSINTKSRLNSTDQTILKEGFVDFGDMWNITTRLIKTQFKEVFLKGFLLKSGTALFISLAAILLGNSMYTNIAPNLDITLNNENFTLLQYDEILTTGLESGFAGVEIDNTRYLEFIQANPIMFATWLLMLAILTICIILAFTIADVRVYQTLNDRDDHHFYQLAHKKIASKVTWVIVLGLIYGVISELIKFIITYFNNPLLSDVVELLVQSIFYGLFGLSVFYIIYSGKNALSGALESYHITLPVFWQNVVRWLLLQLVIISFMVVISILAFILLTTISVAFASSSSVALIGSIVATCLILFIIYLFTIDILVLAFNYVSFYNIHNFQQAEK